MKRSKGNRCDNIHAHKLDNARAHFTGKVTLWKRKKTLKIDELIKIKRNEGEWRLINSRCLDNSSSVRLSCSFRSSFCKDNDIHFRRYLVAVLKTLLWHAPFVFFWKIWRRIDSPVVSIDLSSQHLASSIPVAPFSKVPRGFKDPEPYFKI